MSRPHLAPATRVLRLVDGWGHLVVGPPMLAASGRVADRLGLPADVLRALLAGYVGYGGYVLLRTREDVSGTELLAVALAANAGFVGLCAAALRRYDLTALGKSAARNGIVTGSAMTALLANELRDSRR